MGKPEFIRPTDTFTLIAANTTNFYSTLVRRYKDKFKDEASLLAAAGIIDAATYVFVEKSISAGNIISVAQKAVNEKDPLLYFILELEKMIFEVDQPIMDKAIFGAEVITKECINSTVDGEAGRIKKTMNNWMEVSNYYNIKEPAVVTMMQDAQVVIFLSSLGLLRG